ncbi:PREDICTED: kinesin-like protein KIN-1 [Nelumbo nucifera]|uniref:Kinesin-like protein n=2 Tax=Nelumbo nucifera TaxID=4432 RepID=A0A822YH88_NELNU|nr:PREDICTED: kinesin-like protein KIN-1 [Nelumbo nucifera]DAD33554.1 TPA_asm: hypothetical protein HUJ06_012405 [Nelumbo nucifera]
MSSITVCARFRPLSSKEKRDHNDSICIHILDAGTLIFKDEKEEDHLFCFDRVFCQESEQSDVYEFLALPIIQDAVNAINGTILTYGQTGAGKTYSMEGPNILEGNEKKKGLLPRVVEGLFDCLRSSEKVYTVKLSMVEIYMEKVRDLFDLSKDNLQIKEDKIQGIYLSGVTEVSVLDPEEALQNLCNGIANRAVGETQMNMASSRSHCVYIFTIQQECTGERRLKTGKIILVDLAGSEKVEKTGAEGKVLEEAKTINKSLSALGNVINALTSGTPGKANHIPYRDSKLTRILQDALGGNSRTALLCCCSPSTLNASESLSTLRFGARAKHIKTSPRANYNRDKCEKKQLDLDICPVKDELYEMILKKLREKLEAEDVKLLEELFKIEGIFSDLSSAEEIESAYEDVTFRTVSSLHQALDELTRTVDKLKRENKDLEAKLVETERVIGVHRDNANEGVHFLDKILSVISLFMSMLLVCLTLEKMLR